MAKKTSQQTSGNKLSENIGSIILGFVVVLILGGFLLNVFRDNKGEVGESGQTEKQAETVQELENQYTVRSGDTLWIIAERETGSGYNWTAIAEANNLENADNIEEGVVLTIPSALDGQITTDKLSPTETAQESVLENDSQISKPVSGEYIVQRGDSLWKIAVAQYNDGYQWVKIAQVNNLENPDIIHAGNVLELP